MARKLKLWNGRGEYVRHGDERGTVNYDHFFFCAHSQQDLMNLCHEANVPMTQNEIQVYLNSGCWGNNMDGIKPERGIWGQRTSQDAPERII